MLLYSSSRDKQVLASFFVCGWINFVSDSARGVILPILWSYVASLGGDHKDLGHLLAILSFGRLISHLPYGMLADRARHRITFLTSGVIFSCGAMLWILSEKYKNLRILYLSQLLMGVGTGSMGISVSYSSELSEQGKERTNRIAHLLSINYVGLAVTPFLGPIAVVIGKRLINSQDRYSFPGYLLLMFGCIWIILLFYPFKNVEETQTGQMKAEQKKQKEIKLQELNKGEETSHLLAISGNDYQSLHSREVSEIVAPIREERNDSELAMVYGILITINSLVKASSAFYEVNIARLLIQYYHLDQIHVGLLVSAAGVIGAFQLMQYESFFSNHWTPFQLIYTGLMTLIAAQLLIIVTNLNVLYSPVHLSFQMDRAKHVELIVLVLNIIITYAFAYPIGSTAVMANYSNLQTYGKNSTLQSLMSISSSLSRILASIASSYLIHYRILFYAVYDGKYHIYNQSLTGGVLLLSSTGMLLLIVFRDKIIRYGKEGEQKSPHVKDGFNWSTDALMLLFLVTCTVLSLATLFL